MNSNAKTAVSPQAISHATIFSILFAVSGVHMLNDSMQVVVTALFPVFQESLKLSYVQIGWLTFTLYMTSSVMQPVVGLFSDRRPTPWLLIAGMVSSLIGIIGVALASQFWVIILSVICIGLGSAVFHPEGSKVVYLASGGRRGLAQSIYQVGGNFGSSLAPLMTLFIFVPLGQRGALWAILLALLAIALLLYVVPWYKRQLAIRAAAPAKKKAPADFSDAAQKYKKAALYGIILLLVLVFARSWYSAALTNYYQFFLRDYFGLTIREAQIPMYLFLIFGVFGTFAGGIMADKIGRKKIVVFSLVGSIPLALLIPHLSVFWVYPMLSLLGFVMQSGFSVSVVYAQELMPGKVGMASGLITGFAFGMGAVGAVVLGSLADSFGLIDVVLWMSYLPLIGLLSFLLPKDRREKA